MKKRKVRGRLVNKSQQRLAKTLALEKFVSFLFFLPFLHHSQKFLLLMNCFWNNRSYSLFHWMVLLFIHRRRCIQRDRIELDSEIEESLHAFINAKSIEIEFQKYYHKISAKNAQNGFILKWTRVELWSFGWQTKSNIFQRNISLRSFDVNNDLANRSSCNDAEFRFID